jgi:hypothetical protein
MPSRFYLLPSMVHSMVRITRGRFHTILAPLRPPPRLTSGIAHPITGELCFILLKMEEWMEAPNERPAYACCPFEIYWAEKGWTGYERRIVRWCRVESVPVDIRMKTVAIRRLELSNPSSSESSKGHLLGLISLSSCHGKQFSVTVLGSVVIVNDTSFSVTAACLPH